MGLKERFSAPQVGVGGPRSGLLQQFPQGLSGGRGVGTPGEAPGDGTWGNGGTRQIGFPQGANHQLPGKGRGGCEVVVELEHLCWQTSSHFSPYGLYSHLKKNRQYR